jgi:drug/metabolite transporter (DMT)-like permease
MKRELTYIEPLRAATLSALLYYLVAFPMAVIDIVTILLDPRTRAAPDYVVMLAGPLLYGLVGFLATLIGVCCYNLMAKRLGGVRYTVREHAG